MSSDIVGDAASIDYQGFLAQVLDALEDAGDRYLEEFNLHFAFDYWIAELFETTDEGSFTFTDGRSDRSIDFAVENLQNYGIYQCKCPEIDQAANDGPAKYNADVVNQLLEAVEFMTDPSGEYSAKVEVRDLRSRYQRDLREEEGSTQLEATLAVLGELTDDGQERLDAEKVKWHEKGVVLNLITWQDIYERLHLLDDPSDKDFSVELRVDHLDNDVLHQKDWIVALVYARDLVEAMEEHGVRLFDLNVRNEIPNSAVNKEIVKAVQHNHGRRNFHHLNNGLFITCKSYAKKQPNRILLRSPQVINGCQTVSSLHRAYKALPRSSKGSSTRMCESRRKSFRTLQPSSWKRS